MKTLATLLLLSITACHNLPPIGANAPNCEVFENGGTFHFSAKAGHAKKITTRIDGVEHSTYPLVDGWADFSIPVPGGRQSVACVAPYGYFELKMGK